MFGLGPTELLVICVVALLVLGPQRLPEAAAQLGKAIRSFRRTTRELQDQVDQGGQLTRSFTDLQSALRGDLPSQAASPLIPVPTAASVGEEYKPVAFEEVSSPEATVEQPLPQSDSKALPKNSGETHV